MKREHLDQLRRLLLEGRVLSLAVVDDGLPTVGLAPFALLPDFSGVLVHLSRLSRHGRALTEQTAAGILLHSDERDATSPFQIPRLNLQVLARPIQETDPDYAEARRIYLGRFPESSRMFQLGDFCLYLLQFGEGRFVAGFASAADVGPETFQRLVSAV